MVPNPYAWNHYKLLMIIPLALLVFAAFFIPCIPQGIDLRGGLLLTVYADEEIDANALRAALLKFSPDVDARPFSSPAGKGVEIELPTNEALVKAEEGVKRLHEMDARFVRLQIYIAYLEQEAPTNASAAQELMKVRAEFDALKKEILAESASVLKLVDSTQQAGDDASAAVKRAEEEFLRVQDSYRGDVLNAVRGVVSVKSYSFKEIGASLSKFFFTKTQEVILYAFILSAIIIFVIFRSVVPSFAVIFGAFADIAVTAGFMGLLQIPLTLASTAALLMLIGFSLDTDVLLTVRVIKRKEGTPRERAFDAMKVGFMMNLTTVAAFGVLVFLGFWLQIPTYTQIGLVAVIGGGFVDFVATWCTNAPMILWYMDRREAKKFVGVG